MAHSCLQLLLHAILSMEILHGNEEESRQQKPSKPSKSQAAEANKSQGSNRQVAEANKSQGSKRQAAKANKSQGSKSQAAKANKSQGSKMQAAKANKSQGSKRQAAKARQQKLASLWPETICTSWPVPWQEQGQRHEKQLLPTSHILRGIQLLPDFIYRLFNANSHSVISTEMDDTSSPVDTHKAYQAAAPSSFLYLMDTTPSGWSLNTRTWAHISNNTKWLLLEGQDICEKRLGGGVAGGGDDDLWHRSPGTQL
eukprot:523586-Pelagomonas_calceolata.AAC.4